MIGKLRGLIDRELMSLDVEWWHRLDEGLRAYVVRTNRRRLSGELDAIGESVSERLMVALANRVGHKTLLGTFKGRLMSYEGNDRPTLALCQRIALRSIQSSRDAWKDWLPIISRTYAEGIAVEPFMSYRLYREVRSELPPNEIAREIVEQCDRYPSELVGWAERACRGRVAAKVTPVGTVAETQGWFKS